MVTPSGEHAQPSRSVNDADREAAVERIQQAMVEGHVDFDELDDRFRLVYGARHMDDLVQATAGIPESVRALPVVGHPTPSTAFSLIGDLVRGGWLAVSGHLRAFALIGDVRIDLSTAEIPADGTSLEIYSLIGDVKVIVPDGARVEVHAFSLIGDSRTGMTRPFPGGDVIRIRALSLIGDVRIMSLSQVSDRSLRALWKQLRA